MLTNLGTGQATGHQVSQATMADGATFKPPAQQWPIPKKEREPLRKFVRAPAFFVYAFHLAGNAQLFS